MEYVSTMFVMILSSQSNEQVQSDAKRSMCGKRREEEKSSYVYSSRHQLTPFVPADSEIPRLRRRTAASRHRHRRYRFVESVGRTAIAEREDSVASEGPAVAVAAAARSIALAQSTRVVAAPADREPHRVDTPSSRCSSSAPNPLTATDPTPARSPPFPSIAEGRYPIAPS